MNVNGNPLVILTGGKYNGAVKKLPPDIRAYFVEQGRIGGAMGGHARAASLSPERRREIAQKAIATRWAKERAGKRKRKS